MTPALREVHDRADIGHLADLASEIWNEVFPPIIGQAQVDYMLEKFQSPGALMAQIEQGYRYFFIQIGAEEAGYTGLYPRPDLNALQISKLYLSPAYRGRGIARAILPAIEARATEAGLARLYLTVNKYNQAAIDAYERLGFSRHGAVVADIGAGYVMDDYEMVKPLPVKAHA